ncbi:M15 family metallopeptidase [Noviherbaspirillum sedimenti]|uniref:D-alanyl-D-alanine carboxypeptidase family protein n=1 Tax=Noviherbaspirillum sedimenti TaxID=2320865 RepID=A0A3A3G0I2_9BURK|nr:M15 family metallopeptidase [Noviherbaspirillum sedimenti]RJG01957.1 D-alanyl-D-alanine carboxypeptidase family protein [Noviherbaspirillum sedimenti]
MPGHAHLDRIKRELAVLGIAEELIAAKRLPFHAEAQQLVAAETDARGNTHLLIPAAALAWQDMKQAAGEDGIVIELVSAFRSIERQVDIIRSKLAQGLAIDTILTLSAPPGYSEHHSGCAIDINTPGCAPTEEAFDATDAFTWLTAHAGRFGYTLSYPRANALGFIYEPWHWFFRQAHAIQAA